MGRFRVARIVPLVAVLASTSTARAATQEYTIAQGDVVAACAGEEIEDTGVTSPANVGGVCFFWSAGKSSVRITFDDLVSGPNVGFYYQWYDAKGEFITGDSVDPVTNEPEPVFGSDCGPATVSVIAGARGMKIWLDQAFGLLDCDDPPGTATQGTVTLA